MAYQDAMDALNLTMPRKVPRTEYSASFHWPLIDKVTGIAVDNESSDGVKRKASMAFEKAWDYGLTWSILTHNQVLTGPKTSMGHAGYQVGGVDYSNKVYCPFTDVEQVLSFDPYAAYGVRDKATLITEYNDHYDRNCMDHPDQLNISLSPLMPRVFRETSTCFSRFSLAQTE